jgi:hypothetical protein
LKIRIQSNSIHHLSEHVPRLILVLNGVKVLVVEVLGQLMDYAFHLDVTVAWQLTLQLNFKLELVQA